MQALQLPEAPQREAPAGLSLSTPPHTKENEPPVEISWQLLHATRELRPVCVAQRQHPSPAATAKRAGGMPPIAMYDYGGVGVTRACPPPPLQ